MAISQVRALVNGTWHTLTYNGTTGKYEKSITAPTITSYNVNAGHYYPITVDATNTAGTKTTKDSTDATLGNSLKLTVKEKVKPTITFTSPGDNSKTQNARQPISFQLRDETNGSGVNIIDLTVTIDQGAPITSQDLSIDYTAVTGGYDCTFTPPSNLSDGAHDFHINVTDFDGNAATTATLRYTVDTIPPTLSVTAPANDSITNNSSCTITGTTNDVTSSPVTVTVKKNGVDQGAVSVSSGSFSKTITLSNGVNTIVVRSTDGVGRYTEVTRTVTLDTSQPTISAVTLTPNPVDAGATILIAVTVTG